MKLFYPVVILALYGIQFSFARPLKFKNYNTKKPGICLHQIGGDCWSRCLMPPNLCGRREETTTMCVCMLSSSF